MKQAIGKIPKILEDEVMEPAEAIRTVSKEIFNIAIKNYEGFLLESAGNMAVVIAKFANDLDRD